ncbi:hypothetical protein J2Z30_005419 [Streptomyces iranensis]|nr:hypothetical protein [Streptomyces iranensis]
MGPAGIEGWSRRKREAAQHRKVAYVYACSPGQFALFVQEGETVRDGTDIGTSPGESFSLFSRAVCDVVTNLPHTMHLAEFEEATQQRIAELHTAYRKSRPLQRIRVRTDAEKSGFLVLPGPVRDALKDVSVSLAAHLSVTYETSVGSLREDPTSRRFAAVVPDSFSAQATSSQVKFQAVSASRSRTAAGSSASASASNAANLGLVRLDPPRMTLQGFQCVDPAGAGQLIRGQDRQHGRGLRPRGRRCQIGSPFVRCPRAVQLAGRLLRHVDRPQ